MLFRSELALFDAGLAKKPQIVVLNKMDQPEVQERWPKIRKELKKHGYEPFAISALARTDVNPVLWKAVDLLQTAPEPTVVGELPVYRPEEDPRTFTVEKTDSGYVVRGRAIERAAAMTYWEHDGSVRRFQRLMETLGVEEALRKAGVEEGDTVTSAGFELDWQD